MKNILDSYNFDNYVVVGVSAGPDSMCLLHLLMQKTDKLVVCHINHNVRKESSDEENFLKNYCKEHHLIFECMTVDKYEENNFENEARKKRYSFYEQILKKYHSKYLFLAHHGDDLIETILMKIVRGSNLEGYAGIKEVKDMPSYSIVRPLLPFTKEEIISYDNSHHLTYFIDNSNTNQSYTRNRYRLKILPLLKEEDPLVHQKFLKFSKTLEEYDAYIKSLILNHIDKIFTNNIIYVDELTKLDIFLQKNTLYYILNIIYDNKPNIITEKHIHSIIDLINNPKPNLTLNLPLGKLLVKEYNKLLITSSHIEKKDYQITYQGNHIISSFHIYTTKETDNDDNTICRLNSKNIKLPLYLRNRRDGDLIILKGSNYSKKVKKIFIESKVPASKRSTYPLLVDADNNIIWIPGLKKSKFCIKKDEKNQNYDIIVKCKEREENYE